MQASKNALIIIKSMEGCKLTAYRCPANVLTIGYGSTGPHVKEGMTITQAQAEDLLAQDVAKFTAGVLVLTKGITLTQGQLDALVSFSFNVGLGNLKASTLLKKLLAGDPKGAAEEFKRWNKAGGKVLKGLVLRRELERAEFLRPDAE